MSYHSDLSLIKMESKSFHNLDCNCYDCRIENTRRVDSSGHYIRRESNIQSHKSSTPSIRSPHLNRRMPDKSCVQCGKKAPYYILANTVISVIKTKGGSIMDYIIGGLIGSIFGSIISYKIIHSYYQRKWEQIYFEIIKPFQEGK